MPVSVEHRLVEVGTRKCGPVPQSVVGSELHAWAKLCRVPYVIDDVAHRSSMGLVGRWEHTIETRCDEPSFCAWSIFLPSMPVFGHHGWCATVLHRAAPCFVPAPAIDGPFLPPRPGPGAPCTTALGHARPVCHRATCHVPLCHVHAAPAPDVQFLLPPRPWDALTCTVLCHGLCLLVCAATCLPLPLSLKYSSFLPPPAVPYTVMQRPSRCIQAPATRMPALAHDGPFLPPSTPRPWGTSLALQRPARCVQAGRRFRRQHHQDY